MDPQSPPSGESKFALFRAKLALAAQLAQKQAMRQKLRLVDLPQADRRTGEKAYLGRLAAPEAGALISRLDGLSREIAALRNQETAEPAATFAQKVQRAAHATGRTAKSEALAFQRNQLSSELGRVLREAPGPAPALSPEIDAARAIAGDLARLDSEIGALSRQSHPWARRPLAWGLALVAVSLLGAAFIKLEGNHQSHPSIVASSGGGIRAAQDALPASPHAPAHAAAEASAPAPYVSSDYGFAVAFPGKVTASSETQHRNGPPPAREPYTLDIHTIYALSPDESWIGEVQILDVYPNVVRNEIGWCNEMLDGMQDVGITISSRTPTTYAGHQAVRYDYSTQAKSGLVSGRGYVLLDEKRRAYIVSAMAPPTGDHARIDPFLASFELMESQREPAESGEFSFVDPPHNANLVLKTRIVLSVKPPAQTDGFAHPKPPRELTPAEQAAVNKQLDALAAKGQKIIVCTYEMPERMSARDFVAALGDPKLRDPRIRYQSVMYAFWFGEVPVLRSDLLKISVAHPLAALGNIAVTEIEQIPNDVERAAEMHRESLAATTASAQKMTHLPPPPLKAKDGPPILGSWLQKGVMNSGTLRFYRNGAALYDSGLGRYRGTWKADSANNRFYEVNLNSGWGSTLVSQLTVNGDGESLSASNRQLTPFAPFLNQKTPIEAAPPVPDRIVGIWKNEHDTFSIALTEDGCVRSTPYLMNGGGVETGRWKAPAAPATTYEILRTNQPIPYLWTLSADGKTADENRTNGKYITKEVYHRQ